MDAAVVSLIMANAVRLQLPALAYNLANFLRTLALPEEIKRWSLTSHCEKIVKIGAKVIAHARYTIFQMALPDGRSDRAAAAVPGDPVAHRPTAPVVRASTREAGIELERERRKKFRLEEGNAASFSALGREIRRFGRLRRGLCSIFVVVEAEKADDDLYNPDHPGNVGKNQIIAPAGAGSRGMSVQTTASKIPREGQNEDNPFFETLRDCCGFVGGASGLRRPHRERASRRNRQLASR